VFECMFEPSVSGRFATISAAASVFGLISTFRLTIQSLRVRHETEASELLHLGLRPTTQIRLWAPIVDPVAAVRLTATWTSVTQISAAKALIMAQIPAGDASSWSTRSVWGI